MFAAPAFQGAASSDGCRCRMCQQPEADVRILGCGCEIHARCVPLNLIVSESSLRNNETKPVAPNTLLCPACRASSVSGIYLFPLSSRDLDVSVALRKQAVQEKQKGDNAGDTGAEAGAKQSEPSYADLQAETSYLLLSHNQGSGSASGDHEYQRTGRWTDEEINYVDFLVEAFDNGRIPVEHGLKLNEFLADILLCKSSRLTKKMKNARLSVRSYNFVSPVPRLDVEVMSSLEQKFLDSITSEASRLELKFNISRLWRSHLSNLCLQVGNTMLDANDWIASLEDMERRASEAEERLRKARRRRMGLALRTDVRNQQEGVFFGGVPVQRPPKKAKTDKLVPNAVTSGDREMPRTQSVTDTSLSSDHSGGSDEESDFISSMLDVGHQHVTNGNDDYSKILDDLASGQGMNMPKLVRKNCGPFLEELVQYVESNDIPFQHVDVWVPSYRQVGDNPTSELRLFHAGFGTCHNIESSLVFQLDEYGEYSTRFSFASGVGLPGRVFASGKPVWERRLDEADPKYFERAGGAKVYGVKTGFGFPMRTNVIGLIVVSMYSVSDMPEDHNLMQKCVTDLSQLCPEPKWKLVVEMADSSPLSRPAASPKQAVQRPAALGDSPKAGDKSAPSQTTSENHKPVSEDTEQLIASMLGEYMPLTDLPAAGESTYHSAPSTLVPHFMSLRLLLLRAPDRRSDEEKEMVEVIKKSYEGYANDARRSKRDIALLLVRDWQFLKTSASSFDQDHAKKPAAAATAPGKLASNQHQSHVMEIPTVSTYSSKGAPVMMPQALPFVDPATMMRRPSLRSSTADRVESDGSERSQMSVNIVEN